MAVPGALQLNQAMQLVTGIIAQLQRIPDAVRGFVDAFNPAAGQQLDFAFRSLASTIGYAMEPIITTATRTVNAFAGALFDAMNRLRPVVERVSSLFSTVMTPVMQGLSVVANAAVTYLEQMAPLFEVLAVALDGAFSVLNVVIQAFVALDSVIRGGILSSFGDLKSVTDFLQDAFVKLAEGVIQTTAFFLTLARQERALIAFFAGLSVLPKTKGREGAPQGFQIGGLEDIYRRRLLASAQGGPSVADKQLSAMERIAEYARLQLEFMRADRAAFNQQNQRGAFNFWRDVQMGTTIPAWLQALMFFNNGGGGGRQQQRNQP